MDKIESILNRFPQYVYDRDNTNSALYKLIKSIVDEFDITVGNINRVNDLLDIDATSPEDLYNRWGALLNIKQNRNETNEQYRDRLKVSITSLYGGTASAIKYGVACGLGINNDAIAMNSIHIYDAWEYNGDADITKQYGYIVCEIDMNQGIYSEEVEEIVKESANNVKASGVVIQFIFRNFRLVYYLDLDDITYASLGTSTYSQVGE